jgi:predicted DCC family thiol-disulfide oxidoreductase YuxK
MPSNPILLFDGQCNLCNRTVQCVIRLDRKNTVCFGNLSSQQAKTLLKSKGIAGELPDSVVLIRGEQVLVKSDAVLCLATHLGFPWSVLGCFSIVPRPIRDAIYDWIAANRNTWFGRSSSCWVMSDTLKSRFLEEDARADNNQTNPDNRLHRP